ncbi:MAG: ArsR/SmtB family transcription factor [Candidatus Hadarchaeia archaeon]
MNEIEKDEIELLKCVGSEIRYRILQLLKREEKCVSEIMESLDKEQTLISHHLKSLHKCGLVEKERKGRKMIYKISDSSVLEFMENVKELSKLKC